MKTQLKMMILAGVLGTSAAFAQEPKSSYVITADVPYVTSYVFRGVELAKQAVQPSLTVAAGGLSLGVWASRPIDHRVDEEVDLFGSYDFTLKNDWKLTLGGTVYWYPELDTSTGADESTIEPRLSLSGPLGPVTSTLTVYQDTTLDVTTLEGSLGYSLPMMGQDEDTVDFGVTYGRVSPDVGSQYSYWSASAKATFRPRDNMSIYFGVVYASSNLTSQRNHVYGLVGVSYSFSRP